jgi:hypothetical protein
VSQPQVEIVPLTDDQIDAIHDARFVTTSQDHTMAFALTTDEALAEILPGSGSSYWRSRNPDVREWEVRIVHPEAVALIIEIQEARKTA